VGLLVFFWLFFCFGKTGKIENMALRGNIARNTAIIQPKEVPASMVINNGHICVDIASDQPPCLPNMHSGVPPTQPPKGHQNQQK
jgi:hypothetical protein